MIFPIGKNVNGPICLQLNKNCFYVTEDMRLYPGYLCFFISLRKMIPVLLNISGILQYFVVKLEFTFRLYLICNEG